MLLVLLVLAACAGGPAGVSPGADRPAGGNDRAGAAIRRTGAEIPLPALSDGIPPERAGGYYLGRDATHVALVDGPVSELRLFSGGRAFLRISWPDGESHGAAASWRYNGDAGRLWVLFDPGAPFDDFSTPVDGDPPQFARDGLVFLRLDERPMPETPRDLAADVPGVWFLPWSSGEVDSTVTFTLLDDGVFVEETLYDEGDDVLREFDRWRVENADGLIEFSYEGRPDAGFTALMDPNRGILTNRDGDFRRAGPDRPQEAAP